MLRGTVFDPFGRQEERQQERALIEQYVADMALRLRCCGARYARCRRSALAALPDMIRGFGPVKDANRVKAEERRPGLLSRLDLLALAVAAE